MKKAINREHIEGRIYDHNLEIKVTEITLQQSSSVATSILPLI